jgi:hypothetical protein
MPNSMASRGACVRGAGTGFGGKESAENTIRNLAGFVVYADRPTGNKDTRMEPFAAPSGSGQRALETGALEPSLHRGSGDGTQ